jgi:hypothetical protein
MAYVRTRTTRTGAVSATLVEAYRNENGLPRQRTLANLHGEPDTLRALAKLAALHDILLSEEQNEGAEPAKEGAGFVMITDRALTKHSRRIAQINRQLAAIEREMAVISEHCTASDDALQEAVQRYKEDCCRAFEQVMGLGLARKQADAALRRKLT